MARTRLVTASLLVALFPVGLLTGCPSEPDRVANPATSGTAAVATGSIEGVTKADALAGRADRMPVPAEHYVLKTRLEAPFPAGLEKAVFAMGCFWGAEKGFWGRPGVYTTAVGYTGGFTPNPTYPEVCTHKTGHAESVLVVFDPKKTSYEALLSAFWESHDPTQGMRQGNDAGSQYRSGIYTFSDAQEKLAESSRTAFGIKLKEAGYGPITTEILPAGDFYYAEEFPPYFAKNPGGYCPDHGTGVSCPIGLGLR